MKASTTIIAIAIVAALCIGGIAIVLNNNTDPSGNLTVVDMEGREVSVPKGVDHVACISQSATDLMIAFGLGDKITGTYRSFTYNTWASEIYPHAKDYKPYSYSVAAEELVSDGIRLVITQDTENADSFRNAGIPVVAVHQYTDDVAFDDEIYRTAEIIGEIFNVKDKADAWIKDVKEAIADVKKAIGDVKTDNSVYYVNGEKSKGLYYSDGGKSMISTLVNISNCILATEKYHVLNVHKVSDEEMVSLNPYSIIIGGAYQNNLVDSLESSPVWSTLDANTSGRVYRIPVAMVGMENISAETPVIIKYLAHLLNEDYEYDIHEGLRDNILKYFGYSLTDEDVDNMCMGLSKDGSRMV